MEPGSVGRPSSQVKEENIVNDIPPAASIPLPDAAKEAIAIVLTAMKSVCWFMMWPSTICNRHMKMSQVPQ